MKCKRRMIICAVIVLLTVGFIWTQSMLSTSQSQAESQTVLEMVRSFVELFVGEGNATDHLIRKLAHFAEYSVLGFGLILLISAWRKLSLQNVVNGLFAGLSVAVIDETIQIFSARGAQVQDVLLDYAGCCFGMLVTGLIVCALRRKKPAA